MARALGQIQTKGKLSAEEMNQLAENGIGGWRLLAQEMGKTEAELMKMAADGKLMADDVIPRLLDGMNKAFGGNMEKQSHTLGGRLAKISDTLEQLSAKIGTALAPAFNFVLNIVGSVVDAIDWLATKFPKATGTIIGLTIAIGTL